MNWHEMPADAVARELSVDPLIGLRDDEAERRLKEHGANELAESGSRSPWGILWEQFTALMMVILIIAAILSAIVGDYVDTIAIGVIVILNALLGFFQEYRAEKAIAALKKLAVPHVKVRRNGEVSEIRAPLLVPGDVVLLDAGNFVPADGRILESASLQTQEASLTGESVPVYKTTHTIDREQAPLGDRHNMVYLGTFATAGRGLAIVTETGMRTELGRIAASLHQVKPEPTPLQRRLAHVGRSLAIVALVLVGIILVLGLFRGENLRLLFLTSLSIAVAAVPEGLPAVVTITLALGAQRMLRRKALIRKLPAVETLGSVTVICSDKTGTLTENRMTAAVLQLGDRRLDLNTDSKPEQAGPFTLLLAGGALCNDAQVVPGETALGDPTEAALIHAAQWAGMSKLQLEQEFPRVAEAPFSAERRRMTTVHRVTGNSDMFVAIRPDRDGHVAFTKGAVDSLLEVSNTVLIDGRIEQLNETRRERINLQNEMLAKTGMRVLGVAFRWLGDVPEAPASTLEQNLTFVGAIALIDPPRREVSAAVARCKTAGIRPIMITGDHPLTARHIADEIGIEGEAVVATEASLTAPADSIAVYARVSPEHKLKIVENLKRSGEIVAMTGDGVNDAPALKRADIGVVMGITGTDVAKETADMVLLDDNFATIVAAIEEGRVIYDNVRKFMRYILTTNSGEIAVMLAAPFLGMPLPLLPLQILWMNLVTDGLPALALAVEPAESDTMRRPPHRPNESIFARGMGRHVIWVGLLMAVLSLGVGYWYWKAGDSHWQTIVFTTLTLSQMSHIMAIRSERRSLFQMSLMSNKALSGAVALTVLLQLALVYSPFLQEIFKTEPLPARDLLAVLAVSCIIFLAVELEKWKTRRDAKSGGNSYL